MRIYRHELWYDKRLSIYAATTLYKFGDQRGINKRAQDQGEERMKGFIAFLRGKEESFKAFPRKAEECETYELCGDY